MNFLDNGVPTGLVVDLVQSAARFMKRPVEIRLMNWAQAQQLVLDGKADALIQINPNPERRTLLDFSSPLLDSDFAVSTATQRIDLDTLSDLRGTSVGVERQGLWTRLSPTGGWGPICWRSAGSGACAPWTDPSTRVSRP